MRAISDADFRKQLRADPQSTLSRYDLTDAERAALLGGKAEALLDFGIDKRIVQMLPPSIILDDARAG
ncbi:MAG TPA: Os1348 family NHLP clan protein [Chloroflexota bacterium]|nr:Os1348 family NHLP clan protein [Chloroflexota bacterium]